MTNLTICGNRLKYWLMLNKYLRSFIMKKLFGGLFLLGLLCLPSFAEDFSTVCSIYLACIIQLCINRRKSCYVNDTIPSHALPNTGEYVYPYKVIITEQISFLWNQVNCLHCLTDYTTLACQHDV